MIFCFLRHQIQDYLAFLKKVASSLFINQFRSIHSLQFLYSRMKLDEQTILRCPKFKQGILNLQGLQLMNIDIIPDVINAAELKEIYIQSNFIKQLGEVAKYCWAIKKLSASVNFLSLYSELTQFTQLVYLDLSTNRFSEIGDMSQMVNLKFFNIEHNDTSFIEKLPPNLQILKAGWNNLSNLSFIACEKLTELHLSNNKIKHLAKLTEKCKNIRVLDLSYNLITKQEHQVLKVLLKNELSNLIIISFEGNEIVKVENFVLEVLQYCQPDRVNSHLITPFLKNTFRNLNKNSNNLDDFLFMVETDYAVNLKKQYEKKSDVIRSMNCGKNMNTFDDFKQLNKEKIVKFVEEMKKNNNRKNDNEMSNLYKQMKNINKQQQQLQRANKQKENEKEKQKEKYKDAKRAQTEKRSKKQQKKNQSQQSDTSQSQRKSKEESSEEENKKNKKKQKPKKQSHNKIKAKYAQPSIRNFAQRTSNSDISKTENSMKSFSDSSSFSLSSEQSNSSKVQSNGPKPNNSSNQSSKPATKQIVTSTSNKSKVDGSKKNLINDSKPIKPGVQKQMNNISKISQVQQSLSSKTSESSLKSSSSQQQSSKGNSKKGLSNQESKNSTKNKIDRSEKQNYPKKENIKTAQNIKEKQKEKQKEKEKNKNKRDQPIQKNPKSGRNLNVINHQQLLEISQLSKSFNKLSEAESSFNSDSEVQGQVIFDERIWQSLREHYTYY